MKKRLNAFYLVVVLAVSALLLSAANARAVSEEARRHMDRGQAAVEMAKAPEDYAPAIKEFEQAIRLAPDWPAPYYNLGLAQEKAGKFSDAITSLKQYLRLAPNASDAETVKTLINKLEYKRDRSNIEGRWKVDRDELAVQCAQVGMGVYAFEKSGLMSPVSKIEDIVLEVRKNTDGMVVRVLSSESRFMIALPDGPYVPVRQDGDMVKIFDAVMNTCLSEVSPDHRPWKAKFVLQQTAANVLQGTIKVWGITDSVLSFEPLTLKASPIACDGKIILRREDKVK